MSTGAVFANFADKSDLFREIMIADVKALAEVMQGAASQTDSVEDALLSVFMAGYDFYKTRMPLARAAFSVSWSPDDGPMLRNVASGQPVVSLIAALLEAGVARGELTEGQEAQLRAQMLFDCYLANFVQAIFAGWSEEALRTRSSDQIRIVLAGARHS
jgi:AcrR family transcriptional regulator